MQMGRLSVGLAVASAMALVGACADGTMGPSAGPSAPSLAVTGGDVVAGRIKICKDNSVSGTFTFSITYDNTFAGDFAGTTANLSASVVAGTCETVYIRGADPNTELSPVTTATITETNGPTGWACSSVQVIDQTTVSNSGTKSCPTVVASANKFHGSTVIYTNTVTPPPPPVCDFITFGRLVFDLPSGKVVISGNAGGFKADGSILGNIHIEVGGAKYDVADIDEYFVATDAPLAGANTRVIRGVAKTGQAIELRLRDNPLPGQGEPSTLEGDAAWLEINDIVVLPTQIVDQGNIQLHPQCRGPGSE